MSEQKEEQHESERIATDETIAVKSKEEQHESERITTDETIAVKSKEESKKEHNGNNTTKRIGIVSSEETGESRKEAKKVDVVEIAVESKVSVNTRNERKEIDQSSLSNKEDVRDSKDLSTIKAPTATVKKTKARTNSKSEGKQNKANSTKKITRTVQNQEKSDKIQSTLKQHFQVRRSERKLKAVIEEETRVSLEQKILSGNEDDLEVCVLDDKGRGVFSTKKLKKGDFICEYAGNLIDIKEARKRESEYEKDPDAGCYMYFFEYKNRKYCVDATKESGRLGRLLNHSKTNSNVCTQLYPVNNVPHLILVASKDIGLNEELLYDYGDRSKTSVESHPWLKT